MGLFDVFIKDIETKDNHENTNLKSHYYKNDYNEVKDVVLRFMNLKKFKVIDVNDAFGEILFNSNAFEVIVSIRKINILQTAVDLKVISKALIGGYKSQNFIKEVFEYLNKHLMFVGKGLIS